MNKNHSALEQIKQRGYKQTKLRSFLLDFFTATKKPFSAVELQITAQKKIGAIHKTTIYRELQFLIEQKIIVEIYFSDGLTRYELANLPHHHHLVCNNCQKIEDVLVDKEFKNIEKKISRQNLFKIQSHSLEFFGLCRLCQ
jgi:Fur family ferric uptake transcriptional regulator